MSDVQPQPGRLTERPRAGVDDAVSNAAMADRILAMPAVPYADGAYVVRVAEIPGRKSGRIFRVPIAVTQIDGIRYLISPSRTRPWALNLEVSSACRLISSDGTEEYDSTRATFEEALPALRYYLAELAWASAQFPFAADDPDDQIRSHFEEVAVFRLTAK